MSTVFSPDGKPVGLLNNNPFNIRPSEDNWVGQVGEEEGFSVFSEPIYGIRAADRLLDEYGSRGFNTLGSAINRLSPSASTDIQKYIDFVSEETGLDPKNPIDLADRNTRAKILKALAKIETGTLLEDREISDAQFFNINENISEPNSKPEILDNYTDTAIKKLSTGSTEAEDEKVDDGLSSFLASGNEKTVDEQRAFRPR